MEKITDIITKFPAFHCRKAATEAQIIEAEKILNLTFSAEYKEYVLAFGAASIYGHEFTGICDASRLNVVEVTQQERMFSKDVPSDLYVIECTNV